MTFRNKDRYGFFGVVLPPGVDDSEILIVVVGLVSDVVDGVGARIVNIRGFPS